MYNYEVIALVKSGMLDITANDLDAKSAYQVYKFKKALRSANDSIAVEEREILSELEIGDPAEFDNRHKELLAKEDKTKEELLELQKRSETAARFYEMLTALHNEVSVVSTTPIPYEQWHILQKENATNGKFLYGKTEELLEDLLWVEPES